MITRGAAVILALLFLAGCAGIDVNMGPYYTAPRPDCPVEVVDRRPDPDLIQGNAGTYRISPSVRELLQSKLCGSGAVLNSAAPGRKLAVDITGLEISGYGFVGSDQMLTLVGTVRTGGTDRLVQAYGTVESGLLPSTRWPIVLNSAMDNFVTQVEEALSSRN